MGPFDYPHIGHRTAVSSRSRRAFGLRSRTGPRPIGSDLEYADDLTLDRALEGRRKI